MTDTEIEIFKLLLKKYADEIISSPDNLMKMFGFFEEEKPKKSMWEQRLEEMQAAQEKLKKQKGDN